MDRESFTFNSVRNKRYLSLRKKVKTKGTQTAEVISLPEEINKLVQNTKVINSLIEEARVYSTHSITPEMIKNLEWIIATLLEHINDGVTLSQFEPGKYKLILIRKIFYYLNL